MKMIFAIDENWNIGKCGELLFHIPEDLQRFKKYTQRNIVIMGRKTLESLPEGKPLKNRTNIVFSRNRKYKNEDVKIVRSTSELESLLEEINGDGKREEYLIGGGELTRELIGKCDTAYITKVHTSIGDADVNIPNLDKKENWIILEIGVEREYEGLKYEYVKYGRIREDSYEWRKNGAKEEICRI